jgi:hypothetical protein
VMRSISAMPMNCPFKPISWGKHQPCAQPSRWHTQRTFQTGESPCKTHLSKSHNSQRRKACRGTCTWGNPSCKVLFVSNLIKPIAWSQQTGLLHPMGGQYL